MHKEIVEIEEVRGKKLLIKFKKQQMCSCCRMGSLCGKGKDSILIDNNDLSLKPADKIEIEIEGKKAFFSGILIFLLPSAIFMFALTISQQLSEVRSFFLALGVVCIYYIFLKILLRKHGKKFNLKILRKV